MQGRRRWIAAAEIAAMTIFILTYMWLWRYAFPGAALLCGAGYFGIAIIGHLWRGESARNIGVRWDNWRPAARNAAYFAAITITGTLAIGLLLDSWHFPGWKAAALSIPVTIVWATAQQYGLLCFFYRRFHDVLGSGSVIASAAGAGILFAVFHMPNNFLMIVTLVAGMVACLFYRAVPNVFAIGIAHALISFTLYHALPNDLTGQLRVGPGYYFRKVAPTAIAPQPTVIKRASHE